MSSGSSANDEARYRKIHPIYQAIDAQNYKSAIKLCQRKEIMKWDISKALMAYCLVMSHKIEEGLTLAREVKDNHPTDESVLSALALTFKHGKVDEECCECYENAYALVPSNLSFANELFSCYVKCGDYKKMQQLSQKLYKTTNDPKYIFWTVSSILHQIDSLPVTMLDLAEKMILKILNDTTISKGTITPGAEEIKLLIEILRKRAAHPSTPISLRCELLQRALSQIRELSTRPLPAPIHDNNIYIQDPSIVKSHPTHLKLLSIQVLKDLTAYQTSDTDESVSLDERTARILESNERVLPILREVLTELPDQWDALETLVTFTFDSYVRSKRQEDFRLGDLRNELQHMQSAHSENRGPYLAELLLLQLWMEDKRRTGEVSPILPQCWSVTDESSLSEKFSELNLNSDNRTMIQELIYLLAQYILRYDTKQCCFTDIKPYLSLIDSQEYVHFLHWIRSRCDKIREKLLSNVHLARDAQSDEAAREVPEQICQISKLLQMEYYLKIANHQESDVDPWQFVRSLIDLYSVTHEVAGGKGVGGLREAQPGDELLMLASTVLKRQLLSFRNTVRSLPESSKDEQELIRLSLNWTVLLGVGREKSPHSYCYTVELLEPLRQLACSRYAIDLFNTLGVRYIQLDSMPYLVLPILTEGGLFTEMLKLSKNIVSFHESARRDTLASIAKSFNFCNYAKGLELGEFCNRCQQSTQLALSRTDVPLYEVMNSPNLQAVSTYLQGYVAQIHPESQSELDDEKLKSLVDNMDYHLLTRVDENPILGGESDKKLRRMQYERRITLAQSLLRVIFSTLQNDFASATMKINNLFPQTWVNCLTPPTEDPFGNPIQQSSTSPENGEVPIFWSQQINSGIVDDSSFEQQNLDIILRLCAFAVTSIQLDQLNKATSEAPTSDEQSESLRGTLRRIHQSLIRQFTEIKTNMASKNIKYLQSVGNGRILLLPSWIRKVSSFCRNLGTWGSILLSHLESTILKDSKKKKSKKGSTSGSGKSVSDSEERVLLQELIHEYKQLLSIIETELNQHTDSQLPHTPSVVEFIQVSCQALLQGSDMSEITIKSMEGSMQVLAKQLLSSQELVCTRLRDFMRNRKHFIESS